MSFRFRAYLGAAVAGVLALTSCAPASGSTAGLTYAQAAEEPPCGPNGCVLLEVTDDAATVPPVAAVPPPAVVPVPAIPPPAVVPVPAAPPPAVVAPATVPTTTRPPAPPPVAAPLLDIPLLPGTTPLLDAPLLDVADGLPTLPGPLGGSRGGTGNTGGPITGDSTDTAAQIHRWGDPLAVENFDGGLENWNLYDGPGHAGKGIRSPDQATTRNGVLTISGDSAGKTEGMAWNLGRSKYGRWEGRMAAPVSDPSYNALMLLWPDAENFPVGGEIDFVEMLDHNRRYVDMFLHYGASNSQVHGRVDIDATQWHNWAVEWTPRGVSTFVDGQKWWSTTDTSILPPGSMHLCLQLDWFPQGGPVLPSEMHVDWVAFYPFDGSGDSAAITNDSGSVGTSGPSDTKTAPTTTTPPATTTTKPPVTTTTATSPPTTSSPTTTSPTTSPTTEPASGDPGPDGGTGTGGGPDTGGGTDTGGGSTESGAAQVEATMPRMSATPVP